MRNQWLRSLILSLGFLVAGSFCALSPSALPAETAAPIIQPWPPVAPAPASPPAVQAAPAAADAAPAATLDRPVTIRDKRAMVDTEVQPTGLFSRRNGEPIPNGAVPSSTAVRPMPVGPSGDFTAAPPLAPQAGDVPYTWRQPPAPTPLPAQGTTAAPIVPVPNGAPAPLSIAGPGINGGPIGDPTCDGCMTNDCGGCCPNACCASGCCASGCCDGCGWGGCGNGCCFGNRWYVTAEYLLWFIRGQPLPPLATMGSVTDNPPGAIGQPGTSVLFGNSSVSNNPLSGGRFGIGYWFSDDHCLGIDLRGFFLGDSVNRFSASSSGTPFLARPFVNALTGMQDEEPVATPNGLSGTVSAVARTQLWGAQANLRSNLCCGCNWYIDGLAGWRILGLNDSVTVQENLAVVSSVNPSLPAGSTFAVNDRFATQNLFNGGQIGFVGEYRWGRWSIDMRSTVALGVTQQVTDISGSTLTQAPGQAAQAATGGLLAQTSNIGRHTHNTFAVVPEVGLNLGYQFTNHIRGFVGYNFLYWSSVARAGNQIDPVVNPNLIPPSVPGGPQRPAVNFSGSDFWAQGVQFGLEFRW